MAGAQSQPATEEWIMIATAITICYVALTASVLRIAANVDNDDQE